MGEISNGDAATKFGVVALHEEMPNGERRFRLKKSDGTAYIRTEGAEKGNWQNSHFHKLVLETYIVQAGWIAFAELVDSYIRVRILEAPSTVTTQPGIIHNVYLSPGAVIHTVKHGIAHHEDRLTDARTSAFDRVTHAMTGEAEIRAASMTLISRGAYSDEYRHFDLLIWQVPAWSTAIFTISLQALFSILGKTGEIVLVASFALSLFTSLCLLCFSLVMMRFRTHQRLLKNYSPTPPWRSASTLTQSLVTIESASFFGVSLSILGLEWVWAVLISLALATVLIIIFEKWARPKSRATSALRNGVREDRRAAE